MMVSGSVRLRCWGRFGLWSRPGGDSLSFVAYSFPVYMGQVRSRPVPSPSDLVGIITTTIRQHRELCD